MTETSISPPPQTSGSDDRSANGAAADSDASSRSSKSTTTLGGLFRGWLSASLKGRADNDWRDAIEDLIDTSSDLETAIPAAERDLIGNILRLRELTVYDVMIPRADIVAVDVSSTMEELLYALAKHPHSRLPIYRDSLDDVVGIVHIKDVLAQMAESGSFKLKEIVRDVLIVAPSMTVLELLFEMRESRQHLALVVDEFGGIDGLVTIEDLVEEIVGDIADEHDINQSPEMRHLGGGTWAIDARVPLEVLEETFGSLVDPEEEEDIDTVGGLVFSLAGRIPGRGELIRHDAGLEFEIVDADPRRIRRLVVRQDAAMAGETPHPLKTRGEGPPDSADPPTFEASENQAPTQGDPKAPDANSRSSGSAA